MLQSLALVFHVILAVTVIALVLIQHGKGADAGAAFGSGASATVFGARGATSFLTRATTVGAVLFFGTSLFLFWLAAHRDAGVRSVTDSVTELPAIVEEAPPAPLDDGDLPGAIVPGATGDLPAAPEAGQALPATDGAASVAVPPESAPESVPETALETAPGDAGEDSSQAVQPAAD